MASKKRARRLRKRRRHAILAAAGLCLLLVSAYAWLPWLAWRSLLSAAERDDYRELEERIDFPALRENLRGQLRAINTSNDETVSAATNEFTDSLVDSDTTPEQMAKRLTGRSSMADSADDKRQLEELRRQITTSCRYAALDRFVITWKIPTVTGARADLVLRRRGLFRWRLTEMNMDLDQLKR